MPDYQSADVVCPFYVSSGYRQIKCEELIGCTGCAMVHNFVSQRDKEDWQREVCCSMDYGKRCRIAEAHELYYSGNSRVQATKRRRKERGK